MWKEFHIMNHNDTGNNRDIAEVYTDVASYLFGKYYFSSGQFYVALSRVNSESG